MGQKLPRSKITDLNTTVETEIFKSPSGPVVWAAVEICYSSDGLEPRVTIRVPVPVIAAESDLQRRAEALRRARKLIDHACGAIELQPEESQNIGEMIEGLAEELGVLPATTVPKRVRRV